MAHDVSSVVMFIIVFKERKQKTFSFSAKISCDWCFTNPGHPDQDAEDEDLEVGERLLQFCGETFPVGEEGGDGAEISGKRILQFWKSAAKVKVESQVTQIRSSLLKMHN